MRASRGKVVRAEPVAALYEQRKIFHVGSFPVLEDQQTSFTTDFDRQAAGYSPDRVDSLVWAMTELLVTPMPSYAAYELAREQAEFGMSNGPERPVTLRVFGCLPVTARGAARRQASEKPRRRKPRGSMRRRQCRSMGISGEVLRDLAALERNCRLEWIAGSVSLVGVRAVGPVPAC